jgi:uncharacterized protein YukE
MNPTLEQPIQTDDLAPPASGQHNRTRVRAERYDLGFAWMTAAVAGALAISFIPDQIGGYRLVAPLVAMAAYVIFAFSRAQHNTLRVADSVYFLGFIWTLWALITVLAFQPGLKSTDLYIAFGFALITTASGMFVRLGLIQFYRTQDDQEDEAVDRIDASISTLVRELERAQVVAAEVRAAGVQSLQRWHQDFVKASENNVAEMRQVTAELAAELRELTVSLKNIHQSVAHAGRVFTAVEKRVVTSSGRFASSTDTAVQAVEQSVANAVRRLGAIDIPQDIIGRKFDQLAKSIAEPLSPLAEAARKTVAELNVAIADVRRAVVDLQKNEELRTAMGAVVSKLNEFSKACDQATRTAEGTAKAVATIGTATEQLKQVLDGAEQRTGAIASRAELVASTLHVVGNDVVRVDETLRDVVKFVNANLGQQ